MSSLRSQGPLPRREENRLRLASPARRQGPAVAVFADGPPLPRNPRWFQAFGCVLGFDRHSRGVTTTVCGAVKESLRRAGPEWGLFAAGGKGAASKQSPAQIMDACERLGRDAGRLVYGQPAFDGS